MAGKYDIREIFDEMSLDLIRSQKRNLQRHLDWEEEEGFKWEQWQKSKLRELQQYRKQNQRIVGGYRKEIDKAVNTVLQEGYNAGGNRVMTLIRSITERLKDIVRGGRELTIELPKDISSRTDFAKAHEERPPEQSFFGMNEKKLKALQKSVRSDMRKAEHAALRKMDDVYRQTIYKSQVYMGSGAKSLGQAVDMATKDFLAQGINCIQYKDGKMVNVSSYADMALRTASQRATMMGEGSKRQEWGLPLIVVTAHGNTCELCLPWQGKVLVDDVYSAGKADGEHSLLSTAMAAGLLHPNCRHTLTTYYPGITEIPKQPVDDKTALARYGAEQKQRGMARQVRKYKRLEAGSIDAENVNKYATKVKEWQAELRRHVNENDFLRRDPWREGEKGFQTAKNRDILSDRKWFKAEFSTSKKFDKHIEKHLAEYVGVTPEGYLNIARNLLAAPLGEDIEGFISTEGFTFKYRKSTNDFVIGRKDGKIATLYKPINGYEQWLEEIKKYKKEA